VIVSINQPAYLPWLGYFDRIGRSDLHIVLDHVQFEKNSFTNRNKVRTAQGWTWLTVPVLTKGKFGDLAINALETNTAIPWPRKHWDGLRFSYSKAPHFGAHAAYFETSYAKDWPHLGGLLRDHMRYLLDALGIGTDIVFSSEMNVSGVKQDLVLNLCREVGATTYISGPLGRDYLEPAPFAQAGITLRFHDYQHPEYKQAYPGFEPYMAAVDLLFNHGPKSLEILRQGQELSPA